MIRPANDRWRKLCDNHVPVDNPIVDVLKSKVVVIELRFFFYEVLVMRIAFQVRSQPT
jgi:hypothetical protein